MLSIVADERVTAPSDCVGAAMVLMSVGYDGMMCCAVLCCVASAVVVWLSAVDTFEAETAIGLIECPNWWFTPILSALKRARRQTEPHNATCCTSFACVSLFVV